MTYLKASIGGAILALLMQTTVIEYAKDVYQIWVGCDTVTECAPVEID